MIVIIGGGPAGLFCGITLKTMQPQADVHVYEEHEQIGEPVQCTGILTSEIDTLIKIPKQAIATTISSARIHAPNGKYADIRFARPDIILKRNLFDKHLADLAEHKGVRIYTGHRFFDIKKRTLFFSGLHRNKKITLRQGDTVIGADGPHSAVAKKTGLYVKRDPAFAIQAVMQTKHDNRIHFYPHIGEYAWLCPEGRTTARIGIDARKDSKQVFDTFIAQFKGTILSRQAGYIPTFRRGIPKQKTLDGISYFLIGDAACQTKNTTGGGIIAGMKAGKLLAGLIAEGKERQYEKKVWKEVEQSLYLHYLVNKAFQKFSDEDWNRLIAAFSKKKLSEILAQTDRDNLSTMLPKIIMNDPTLLLYTRFLL
jgi:flavin-dependent dehydrogenase